MSVIGMPSPSTVGWMGLGAAAGVAASTTKVATMAAAAKGYLASGVALASAHPVIATGIAAVTIYNLPKGTFKSVATVASGVAIGVFAYKMGTGLSAYQAAAGMAKAITPLLAKGVALGAAFAVAHPYLFVTLAVVAIHKNNPLIGSTVIGERLDAEGATVATLLGSYGVTFLALHPYFTLTMTAIGGAAAAAINFYPDETSIALSDLGEGFVNGYNLLTGTSQPQAEEL